MRAGKQYAIGYKPIEYSDVYDSNALSDLILAGMVYRMFKVTFFGEGTVAGKDPLVPAQKFDIINQGNINEALYINDPLNIMGQFTYSNLSRQTFFVVIPPNSNVIIEQSGIDSIIHVSDEAQNELAWGSQFPRGFISFQTPDDGTGHIYYISIDANTMTSSDNTFKISVLTNTIGTKNFGVDPINFDNAADSTMSELYSNLNGLFINSTQRYCYNFSVPANCEINFFNSDGAQINGRVSELMSDGSLSELAAQDNFTNISVSTVNDNKLHHLIFAVDGADQTAFSIIVTTHEVTDIEAGINTQNTLQLGVPQQSFIDKNDVDFWKMDLVSGYSYKIDLSKLHSDVDTILELRDQDGNIISINDDITFNSTNSSITFTCNSTGTYFATASAFFTNYGEYEIVVNQI